MCIQLQDIFKEQWSFEIVSKRDSYRIDAEYTHSVFKSNVLTLTS